MAYQNQLNVGDIITIGKSTSRSQHWLVVRSERVRSDPGDGVPYIVDEIDVVPTGMDNAEVSNLPRPAPRSVYATLSNDGMKSFYFEGGSMHGKGSAIKVSDVRVVGTCSVKQKVHVTYTLSNAKFYG